ncbi:DUF6527 family protein [Streptomyces rubiginosohelvolus]|uniref:DUF6527 family protein n=1 Tax=Streptomyces rubiginosohelvolus TaxID=67362 RepID=UPI003711CD49
MRSARRRCLPAPGCLELRARNGENVSLTPSIGNWSLPCRSHYWICDGRVRWSRRYAPSEIDQNQDRDRRLLAAHDVGEQPGRAASLRGCLWPWRLWPQAWPPALCSSCLLPGWPSWRGRAYPASSGPVPA